MKNWILGVALLTMISVGAQAQQQQRKTATPEERASRMTERMAQELQLSEQQKKEIYAINLERAQKRMAEQEVQKAEMQARREQMKSEEQKVLEVLTVEQRQKWEEIKLEQRDRRRPQGAIEDRGNIPVRRMRGSN
mgnify:CR=1 FL=1